MMHLVCPIIMNFIYINIPKKQLQYINPRIIFMFSLIHNLFLHSFSLYIFIKLTIILWENRIIAGRQYYFQIKEVDTILFWFYISKYYEFIDTCIIYAKKKNPIFLQKYHHMGASFMWHLGYIYKFDGILFASLLNSGIHTLMYAYYFCTLFPYLSIKLCKYKVYITTAQIGQLVYGAFALPWFYYSLETTQNKVSIILCDIYISILLVLFGKFMINNYFDKKKKTQTV